MPRALKHKEKLSLLQKNGFSVKNVNSLDSDGKTPLFAAIYKNCGLDIVRALLYIKADVNKKNANGLTPLFAAVKNGELAIVEELLSAGADTNASKYSVLYKAVSDGKDVNIIKALIRAGADVNYKKNLNNMLHVVCEAQTAEELLLHQVGVNAKNDLDETPLFTVIKNNRDISVIEALLRGGADVSVRNKEGETPIFVAVSVENLSAVKTLVSAGSSINITNNYDETPLYKAIMLGSDDIALFLLAKGSNLSSKTTNTLLHIAQTPLAAWHLLRHRIDVNARNQYGQTPLHVNAVDNDEDTQGIVRELIRSGAKVNVVDFKGNTPLHYALFNHNLEMVELLMENGADIHIVNSRDSSPIPFGSPWNLSLNIDGKEYATCLIRMFMFRKPSFFYSEILGSKPLFKLIIHFCLCLKELKFMERVIMSNNQNFYEFLKFNIRIDLEKLNEEYENFQKYVSQFFPIYASTIKKKMKTRIDKEKRLLGFKILSIAAKSKDGKKLVVLNYDCVEKISEYLNDDDIRKFLEVFDINVGI